MKEQAQHEVASTLGNNAHHERNKRDFAVVGIGVTAVGLDSLTRFLGQLPDASGMAYVVVLAGHSQADMDHALSTLSEATRLPVTPVSRPTPLELNHVFVVAPGKRVAMSASQLIVSEFEQVPDGDAQLALFFRSHLLLSPGETADAAAELFTPVDRKHRIYQANLAANIGHVAEPAGDSRSGLLPRIAHPYERRRASFSDVHQQVLEHYAPPSVIVNDDLEIVHMSDNAGRFLGYSGGEPSHTDQGGTRTTAPGAARSPVPGVARQQEHRGPTGQHGPRWAERDRRPDGQAIQARRSRPNLRPRAFRMRRSL